MVSKDSRIKFVQNKERYDAGHDVKKGAEDAGHDVKKGARNDVGWSGRDKGRCKVCI